MNLITTLIAGLMVGDALFSWMNLAKLESFLSQIFPHLNLRRLALTEGGVGVFILLFKLATHSLY